MSIYRAENGNAWKLAPYAAVPIAVSCAGLLLPVTMPPSNNAQVLAFAGWAAKAAWLA
jgi:hypothetical protein